MAAEAARRRPVRAVNGILLLDKPAGMTSNQALQEVKRLLGAKKAGHTGSLDPAATGMLPLCFGEATKVSSYLLDADKRYRVVARLGEATDTGDADGRVTDTAAVPALVAEDWGRVFTGFTGRIEQVPPMYSALKHEGRRLHELARRGEVVERRARSVTISALDLLEARGTRLAFRVACSKGTYVRTLVEDLARAAGTIAHTVSLRREAVAGFAGRPMVTLERLRSEASAAGSTALDSLLLPIDAALEHWPAVSLDGDGERAFRQGQPARAFVEAAAGTFVRAYGAGGAFLGIATATGDGRVAPKRRIRTDSQN